jgi:Lrp/AsnC family leucine-responsive transcriptional regulator
MILTRICLERTDASASDAFKAAAMSRPEIVECHEVDGDFDYLLKTRVPDMARYRTVLAALPHVRETRSFTVIDEVKVCERQAS